MLLLLGVCTTSSYHFSIHYRGQNVPSKYIFFSLVCLSHHLNDLSLHQEAPTESLVGIHCLLTGRKGRTVKYQAQGFKVRTELANNKSKV